MRIQIAFKTTAQGNKEGVVLRNGEFDHVLRDNAAVDNYIKAQAGLVTANTSGVVEFIVPDTK